MRRGLSTNDSTSHAIMYLELGWIPIIFLLKERRLLYLHYVLNESAESMIFQFMQAQLAEPLRGDWAVTIREDIKDLKLDKYSFDEIRAMSKIQFKTIIQPAIRTEAFNYLIQKKNTQSKIKHIKYLNLSMQPYLKPNSIVNSVAKFHFKARSSMLNLRGNFKSSYKDTNFCQGCLDISEPETQIHAFYCNSLASTEFRNADIKYEDLFSDNLSKQLTVSNILMKRMEKRDQLIKSRETNSLTHTTVGSQ